VIVDLDFNMESFVERHTLRWFFWAKLVTVLTIILAALHVLHITAISFSLSIHLWCFKSLESEFSSQGHFHSLELHILVSVLLGFWAQFCSQKKFQPPIAVT